MVSEYRKKKTKAKNKQTYAEKFDKNIFFIHFIETKIASHSNKLVYGRKRNMIGMNRILFRCKILVNSRLLKTRRKHTQKTTTKQIQNEHKLKLKKNLC